LPGDRRGARPRVRLRRHRMAGLPRLDVAIRHPPGRRRVRGHRGVDRPAQPAGPVVRLVGAGGPGPGPAQPDHRGPGPAPAPGGGRAHEKVMAMQRAPRVALVTLLALLGGLGLAGCRSEPSVAAYVGEARHTQAEVDRIATVGPKEHPAVIVNRQWVLRLLV